jgi:hypothetical protein
MEQTSNFALAIANQGDYEHEYTAIVPTTTNLSKGDL